MVRLDTPAGLVEARVEVSDGVARSVTIRNVPSFSVGLDRVVDGARPSGRSSYDMAYGGNFYAIVPIERVGLPFERAAGQRILDRGLAVMAAINETDRPVHPLDPDIDGLPPRAVRRARLRREASRHAMAIHPGWFDRSPCGTGTSARMAQLHARGELGLGEEFVNESFIGTRFTGRLVEEAHARRHARPSSRRSPAGRGSPGWASTCWLRRTRFRAASCCRAPRPQAPDVAEVSAGHGLGSLGVAGHHHVQQFQVLAGTRLQ